MNNELIKIIEEDGKQLVSARELHEFLSVGKDFTTWVKGRINKYGFEENIDFTVVSIAPQNGGAKNRGGNNKVDYIITIDMGKELSMVENNDKGREARKYFINCEKQLKKNSMMQQFDLPTTYKEALLKLVEAEEEKELLLADNKLKEDKLYIIVHIFILSEVQH